MRVSGKMNFCITHSLASGISALLLLCSSLSEAATLTSALGAWEVSRVISTGALNNSQRLMLEDDARLMGRRLMLGKSDLAFRGFVEACHLSSTPGGNSVPLRALFEKEKVRRPPAMKGLLYGRAVDADLGALAKSSANLQLIKCTSGSEHKIFRGNWIAVTSDKLFVYYSADTLLMFSRPPKSMHPKHAAYCASATKDFEKSICADRQLWLLHSYVEAAELPEKNASSPRMRDTMVAEDLDFLRQRDACKENIDCLRTVLEEQVDTLVQRGRLYTVPKL
jgi:hypothetical protein